MIYYIAVPIVLVLCNDQCKQELNEQLWKIPNVSDTIVMIKFVK